MQEYQSETSEKTSSTGEEVDTSKPETKHEPHMHAKRRILVGTIALLFAIIAFFTWVQYGEGIKEWCTGGDEGACTIDLEDVPAEGITFEQPVDF